MLFPDVIVLVPLKSPSLPKANLNKPRKYLSPERKMDALDECFLMVVFTLLLNRVHGFANFMSNLNRETLKVLMSLSSTDEYTAEN